MFYVELWVQYPDDEGLEIIEFDTRDEAIAFISENTDAEARLLD